MPVKKPLGNTAYHRIGCKYADRLEPNCTFLEIGKELGVSKQKAYYETMIALGKLIHRIKQIDFSSGCQ